MSRVKWVAAVAVTVAALRAARRVLLFVPVSGVSMEPGLRAGQRLLAVRRPFTGPLRAGEVVVVRHRSGPGAVGHVVKRVTAVAGDRVPGPPGAVLDAGQVWLDGVARNTHAPCVFGVPDQLFPADTR